MPPSSLLQDLNIIQTQQPSDPNDLLANPPFSHDLAAHLELWSSVNFATDEPFISNRDRDALDSSIPYGDSTSLTSDSFSSKGKQAPIIDPALTSPPSASTDTGAPSPQSADPNSSFFYDNFLPGFHPDHYPHNFAELYGDASTNASLHAFGGPTLSALNSRLGEFAPSQALVTSKTSSSKTAPGSSSSPDDSTAQSSVSPRPSKKAKTATAKSKVAARAPPPPPSESAADGDEDEEDDDDVETSGKNSGPDLTTPATASEDKRRRNTAASARFRLKKKEREQAMERKAKDLESRVGELERECEALRRENGWLKGLVVGVTGGQPGEVPPAGGIMAPNPLVVPASVTAAVGSKRARDD